MTADQVGLIVGAIIFVLGCWAMTGFKWRLNNTEEVNTDEGTPEGR